jgi:serine/threonine protein kinase
MELHGNDAAVGHEGTKLANLSSSESPHDGHLDHFVFGSSLNAIRPNQLGVPLLYRYPYVDFRWKEIIGRGRFTTIYKALSLKDLNLKVAVKEVRLQEMNRQQIADFRYELNVLSNLRHPNLGRIASVFDSTSSKNLIYVVTEYLCGGELIPAICRQRQYMETDAVRFIKQLISAVQYLHSHGVVHGKIVPENLILTHPSFESNLRLVDFGLAQAYTMYHQYHHPNYIHLDEFHVPELACERRITPAMDVWCVGVITYIILSGQIPFEQNFKPLNKESSFEDSRWTYVSPEAIDFLCKILTIDPKDRPIAEDMAKHPWIDFQDSCFSAGRYTSPNSPSRSASPLRDLSPLQSKQPFVSNNNSKILRASLPKETSPKLTKDSEEDKNGNQNPESPKKKINNNQRIFLPSSLQQNNNSSNNSAASPSSTSAEHPDSHPLLIQIIDNNDEGDDDDDDDFYTHYDLTTILPHIRAFYEARQMLHPVLVFSSTINFAKLGRYMTEKKFAVLGGSKDKLLNLIQSSSCSSNSTDF